MQINANPQQIKSNLSIDKVVYPKLSYELMGIFYKIHNTLGPNHPEKHYQRAIEIELAKTAIPFTREKFIRLAYEGELIGRYFIDFIVDNKIAIETKTIDFFTRKDWRQVRSYLDAANLKLAILVNFNTPKVTYKRILNSKIII